ncbi:DUF1273 family protein [Bradyrhizobium liaoningense]|uniref:SLOG family protein n=1 Tax=Bradyrhizobium liaoningense TaxID=43992 RepID=UPI001BAE0B44|nr:SLOG family protein [Bradyrhizobium liaoningense]MBR0876925.1 DUF1273 family protein [Bradyrhizobium liaoningense]
MIITATGHPPNKLGGYGDDVRKRLRTVARNYLGLSLASEVVSGMALGWDQAFAEAAIQLGIPFVAAVPFEGQDAAWPAPSRAHYGVLLSRAARVVIVSEGGYSPLAMHRRNEWMVDYSHRVCALWDGSNGGTASCLRYARKMMRTIDNVWQDFVQ